MRPISVYTSSLWYCLCTSHVPEGDGYHFTGIDGVICYVDDILVTGDTEEVHLQRLKEVFTSIWQKKKSHFLRDSIDYLGHKVDAEGISPLPEKVEAIEIFFGTIVPSMDWGQLY